MFTYNDETRFFWFSAAAMLGLEMEYELIGMLVGLAIYNGHILEFRFPMLIYRKLMGHRAMMRDLKEVNPWVHDGFRQLLDAAPVEVEVLPGRCISPRHPTHCEPSFLELNATL